jgi:hypothetical protein
MAAILNVCKVRGRERCEREREGNGRDGREGAWFEQLQGVLVGQDSASGR